MLGVRIDADLENRLAALAEKTQRSKSYLVKQAISDYLQRQEVIAERNAETLTNWAEYNATGVAVDGDVVNEWIASWGAEDEKPCPIRK